jgi:hypothetical protein
MIISIVKVANFMLRQILIRPINLPLEKGKSSPFVKTTV